MLWLNDQLVEFGSYPNGETRMPVLDVPSQLHRIRMAWRSDQDLIRLMCLRRYLRAIESDHYCAGTSTFPELPWLEIEYMPYSRMDRAQNGAAFTLEYVCDLINDLRFGRIEVWEPHSPTTIGLLSNAHEVRVTDCLLSPVEEQLEWTDEDLFVFPDKGAVARYGYQVGMNPSVVMEKERDFDTGRITDLRITDSPPDMTGRRALIIDDLCSFGGTFSWAAKLLHERGVTDVYLLVAHLELDALRGPLLQNEPPSIKGVFATESMFRKGEHEVGDPFEETPTGYTNHRNGTFVRLFEREEWR